MTYYLDDTRDVIAQRKALLHAVRVLTNHGHHEGLLDHRCQVMTAEIQ